MSEDETPGPQHYRDLLEAFSRDFHLTCPLTLKKVDLQNQESRTRLRFNSLFEITEFTAFIHLQDAEGKLYRGEVEFGIWQSDGQLEVFDSSLTPG